MTHINTDSSLPPTMTGENQNTVEQAPVMVKVRKKVQEEKFEETEVEISFPFHAKQSTEYSTYFYKCLSDKECICVGERRNSYLIDTDKRDTVTSYLFDEAISKGTPCSPSEFNEAFKRATDKINETVNQ